MEEGRRRAGHESILLSPQTAASVLPATDGASGMSGRVVLMEWFAKSTTTEARMSQLFYEDEVIGFGL